jgi:hypothetical protein
MSGRLKLGLARMSVVMRLVIMRSNTLHTADSRVASLYSAVALQLLGSVRAPTLYIGHSRADLVFRWQNGVPIAPAGPQASQVVRSTPLGMPCSELQEYNAPRPRFCPQSGYAYVPAVPRSGSQLGGFPVPPGILFREGLPLS